MSIFEEYGAFNVGLISDRWIKVTDTSGYNNKTKSMPCNLFHLFNNHKTTWSRENAIPTILRNKYLRNNR